MTNVATFIEYFKNKALGYNGDRDLIKVFKVK